jgi:hypothetical protein
MEVWLSRVETYLVLCAKGMAKVRTPEEEAQSRRKSRLSYLARCEKRQSHESLAVKAFVQPGEPPPRPPARVVNNEGD